MTKPIEDTNNAAAIRTALDVPTTGALNTVGDAAQAAAETAAAKYTKPSTGIPASDLAAAAQTSLGKADSAIQDLAGMTAKFNAGTAPEKAAFQSSVSGATVATLSSAALVRVAVLGDSTARNQYTPRNAGGLVGSRRDITAFGAWAVWACAYSGGLAYPDVYAFEGYSGFKCDQVLAAVQSATATEAWGAAETIQIGIRARAPQIVFDTSSTNDIIFAPAADITSGAALARAIAGRRAIWAYIRGCGGMPIAVSQFPCQGSFTTGGGALSQDQLKPYKPVWNAAMKAAADADGVAWLDAYTPCASADGGWKTGYIYHNGVDDATGVHPSLLASLAIGKAGAELLKKIIKSAPFIPRLQLGGSPIYSAAFVANDKRQFFGNFDTGLFPNTAGWAVRYDPQADGSFALSTPTIDSAGGGTIKFVKPANAASRYADWKGPDLTVTPGQEYLWFFDVNFSQVDYFGGVGLAIVDRTSGSASAYQPLCQLGLSAKEAPALTAVDSGVCRLALYYKVPAGINSVCPLISVNRSAGGASSGSDFVLVANVGQMRLS